MDTYNFDQWCSNAKLSKKTIDLLIDQELTEGELLIELSELDIASFDISLGQKKALTRGIRILKAPGDRCPPAEDIPGKPVTNEDLKKDGDLNQLLQEISSADQTLGAAAAKTSTNDAWLSPQLSKGKPLTIPDFISTVYMATENDEQVLACTEGGADLKLVMQKAKTKVESLSLPQWTIGNARILNKLITEGKITTFKEVQAYLAHTVKVGELALDHYMPGLMRYDHEYRLKEHQGLISWGDDDIHLSTRFLKPNVRPVGGRNNRSVATGFQGQRQGNAQQRSRPPRMLDRSGREICLNFQNREGCNRAICKFSHVCLAKDCYGPHPEYLHNTITDNTGA